MDSTAPLSFSGKTFGLAVVGSEGAGLRPNCPLVEGRAADDGEALADDASPNLGGSCPFGRPHAIISLHL